MPNFSKLGLHGHAGAKLFDRMVDLRFGDRPLPVARLPLDRESFALGRQPSPVYM